MGVLVSTPCRGITCAELWVAFCSDRSRVSTPCRGITCAEAALLAVTAIMEFLPPVGESPVLSTSTQVVGEVDGMFLPPVGESPVLRLEGIPLKKLRKFLPPVGESSLLSFGKGGMSNIYPVSTPCRGIISAEAIVVLMVLM